MITLYGIKTCDSVRKARRWLDDHSLAYEFYDFREQGVDPFQLRLWAKEFGWQALLNKRSKTWRDLPEQTKNNIDEALAFAVMEDQPTIIKRPILETERIQLLGFSDKNYRQYLLS